MSVQASRRSTIDPWGRGFLWLPCLVTLLLATGGPPCRGQEAPAVQAQQAAERWAAVTAAREIISELDAVRPDGLTGQWSRAILDDPRSHQKAQASRSLLEHEYFEEIRGILQRRLVRLHSSLNPVEGSGSFTADWLVGYVDERLDGEVRGALRANADRHFGALFDRARRSAVAAQLAGLEVDARPGLDEVDALAVSGWSQPAETQLRERLVARMSRSITLLEESAARLEAKASELIADGKRQYEEQAAALELPVDPALRVADEIARALRTRIEEARLKRRMTEGPDSPIYDVFPSLERRLRARAGEIELRRFADYVRRTPEAIDPGEVQGRVEADLARHRVFQQSLDLLTRELSPVLARDLSEEYSQPVAKRSRRAALRGRLRRGLDEDADLSTAFEQRVQAALAPTLRDVHREIGERQMAELFPEVASGRLIVSQSLLLRLRRQEIDFTTFEQCLEIPRLREGGGVLDRDLLLESTEQMVLGSTGKLLQEAKRALQEQLQLVQAQEPSIAPALRSVRGERPVSYWETIFIDQVETRWRERGHPAFWRGSAHPPPNAATKYLPLFGYVEDEVRKNVRAHFEPKLGTSDKAKSEPESDPKPGTSPGEEGNPDEEDDPETADQEGWWLWGAIKTAAASWLTWLMLLLTVLLIVLTLRQHGAWRAFLSAAAWVLATVILFASFFLLGKLTVGVADLDQATAELEQILGVPPSSVGSDRAVFKLGPISRIVLRRAEPSRGVGGDSGAGGER